jgi:hypothetical protein
MALKVRNKKMRIYKNGAKIKWRENLKWRQKGEFTKMAQRDTEKKCCHENGGIFLKNLKMAEFF